MSKFHLKNGDLTVYALACGYMQKHSANNIETTLYHEGCLFHVRSYNFVEHKRIAWESFESIGEARKEYRRQCKNATINMEKLVQEYINCGGVFCPFCQSNELSTHNVEFNEGVATQDVSCNDCQKHWTDTYTLLSVQCRTGF